MAPKLKTLKMPKGGAPFAEALKLAKEQNIVIASNRLIDNLLTKGPWKLYEDVLPVHSGTMTAYVRPDEPFGAEIRYTDERTGHEWVFPVPPSLQKEKNAILVAEHPTYTVEEDGNKRVVRVKEEDILLVQNFGRENGWHIYAERTRIPIGEKGKDDEKKRYLCRIDARIGPVDHGYYGLYFYLGRESLLDQPPSSHFNVLVEGIQREQKAPEAPTKAPTEEAIKNTGEHSQLPTYPIVLVEDIQKVEAAFRAPIEKATQDNKEQAGESAEKRMRRASETVRRMEGINVYKRISEPPLHPKGPEKTEETGSGKEEKKGKEGEKEDKKEEKEDIFGNVFK